MYDRRTEILVAVAESGSFSKAATELYVSPVSVIKQMNALEAYVGVTLFERTHRGVTLTPAGKSLYEGAKQIVRLSDETLRRVREIAESEKRVIRVGTSLMRPCKPLIDLWTRVGDDLPFRIEIVPFGDDDASLQSLTASLGDGIDCYVGPCGSRSLTETQNVHLLGECECRVAVPRTHRLADARELTWADLEGESLMLVKRGEAPVLDRIRDEVESAHPGIRVVDFPHLYDTQVFNECERAGCAMETLDIWADVHPSLVTIPMSWDYAIPYGIVYARDPSEGVAKFMDALRREKERPRP